MVCEKCWAKTKNTYSSISKPLCQKCKNKANRIVSWVRSRYKFKTELSQELIDWIEERRERFDFSKYL